VIHADTAIIPRIQKLGQTRCPPGYNDAPATGAVSDNFPGMILWSGHLRWCRRSETNIGKTGASHPTLPARWTVRGSRAMVRLGPFIALTLLAPS